MRRKLADAILIIALISFLIGLCYIMESHWNLFITIFFWFIALILAIIGMAVK